MRIYVSAGILAVAIMIKLIYQFNFDNSSAGVPTITPLENFPWGIAGEDWREERNPLDERVIRIAGVTEYLNCTYAKKRKPSIWFYVGYYDGAIVESMHQPEICFPGSGWTQENKRIEEFFVPEIDNVKFNVIEFKKNRMTRVTAYTFFYRGIFQPDQSVVEKGRAFGDRHFAIITVATDTQDSIQQAKSYLEGLLQSTIPELLKHLPLSNQNEESLAASMTSD